MPPADPQLSAPTHSSSKLPMRLAAPGRRLDAEMEPSSFCSSSPAASPWLMASRAILPWLASSFTRASSYSSRVILCDWSSTCRSTISCSSFWPGMLTCLRLRFEPDFNRKQPVPERASKNKRNRVKRMKQNERRGRLTRNGRRLGEAPEDLGVDVDGQLLLLD